MSENDEQDQQTTQPDAEPTSEPTSEPDDRPGWRQRAYGVRSVAAVAVAGLIIGGGAGAAIHAATADDGGRDGGPDRMGFQRGGPDGGRDGGPGDGQPQPPDGMPGAPDDGGATTSGDDT
jgi:hypothetical protein